MTFYAGRRDGRLLGYAAIDIHTVRTLPEAFLVVLSPGGEVVNTLVLAFYEPPEYLPPDRWREQFRRRTLAPDLWLGRGIAGITGATLTAEAVTRGVRKVLALYEVLLRGRSE